MAEDRKIQAAVSLDTSDAERGFARVEQSARKMATSAAKAAQEAGKAIDGIGDGANESAQKFSRAEASIRREIEKSTLALKTMGQAASKRIETTIDFKGLDRAKFEPYLAQLREAERLQDQVSRSMGNMGTAASGARENFLALARTGVAAFLGSQVVQGASRAASALYEASAAGERLRTTLDFATGNSAREMAYLMDLTARYGLRLNDTAKAYASFAAAARGTALEGQKTRDVFESISKASAVMGLTSEQSAGALLALQQMVSKGTVQAEELRGQLGERLPGAFQVAAKAMGVTTQRLGEMLEQGQVIADDFLPKFAAALNEHIGDAAEKAAGRLDAAVNRLDNAWEKLKRNIGDSGVSAAMSREMTALSGDITAVSDAISRASRDGDSAFLALAKGAGVAAGRSGLGALALSANTLNGILNGLTGGVFGLRTDINLLPAAFMTSAAQAEALAVDIAAAEKELARLKELDAMPMNGNYFRDGVVKTQALIDKLKEARRELLGLSGESGGSETYSVGSGDAALARAQRAEYDRQAAARDALIKKYATSQEKLNEAIASAKASLGDLYSPEIERRITEHFIKPTKAGSKAAKEARDEFGELYNRLTARDVGLSPTFYKDLDTLHKGYELGRIGLEEYRAAVDKLVSSQQFAIDATKAQEVAEREALKAREQLVQAQERSAGNVEQQVQKLKDEEEALAISAAMNISLAQAIEEVSIARLREQQAALMKEGDRDAEVLAIQREIDARKKLAEAIGRKETREANKKQAEDAAREWEKTADQISQSLTDALMRGFESGKGFGESLADSIVNTFKTYVAREIAKAISNAILSAIAGQNWAGLIGGALGGNGGSGYGSLLSGANNASSLTSAYNTFANGAGSNYGAAASWATGGMSTANLAGSIYANAATSGMATGSIAASGAGIDALLATNAAYGTAATGAASGMAGASSAISAIPVWGWVAIAGMALWEPLFGRKLKEVGTQINFREGDISTNDYKFEKGGWFRSDKTTMLGDTTAANKQLVQQAENIQESAKGMARALGFGADAIDSFSGTVNVNMKGVKSNEEAAQRYNEALMELQRQMLNAATGAEFTKEQFADFMAGIQQDMAAVGISAEGIADILVQGMMGKLSQQEVGDALADMMVGGIYESIAQNYAGQIAQAFTGQILTPIFTALAAGVPISQAISQQAIANVVATAQQAAAAMNAIFSNAEFRSAIAGIQQAIGGVAGAVTKVKIPSFGSARSVRGAASGPSPAQIEADRIAKEREGLERQLLQLQGDTVELRRRELQELAPANRSLQERIWALEEEQRISQEREGIERRMLELNGRQAQLRAMDLAALDASNRALQEHVWALEDQANAASQAAGLVRNLMQALGDTAGLRQMELDAVDPSARYLQEALWALEDASATEEKARQKVDEAKSALRDAYERERDAYERERDAYERERREIQQTIGEIQQTIYKFDAFARSLKAFRQQLLIGNNSPLSLTQRQAEVERQFADVARRARLGDVDAIEELQGISSDYLAVSMDSAKSAEDYYRSFAKVKNVLEDTESLAQRQIDMAQRQIDMAQRQIDMAERQLDTAERQLEELQQQFHGLIDINESVLSVEQAVRNVNSAISGLAAATISKGSAEDEAKKAIEIYKEQLNQQQIALNAIGGDTSAANSAAANEVMALYESIGRVGNLAPSQAEIAYWARQDLSIDELRRAFLTAASGETGIYASSAEIAQELLKGISGYASGGVHSGGLRIVGENGPELELTGPSRIWSAEQTQRMLSGSANDELVAEVRQLRKEIAEMKYAAAATARNSNDTVKILQRVTNGGNAMLTEAVA